MELSKLAEKDPEFYKYLQENDKELLDFDPDAMEDAAEAEDDGESGSETAPVLTKQILQTWQKALLEVCPQVRHDYSCLTPFSLSNIRYEPYGSFLLRSGPPLT